MQGQPRLTDRSIKSSQRRYAHSKRHVSTAVSVTEKDYVSPSSEAVPSQSALSCLPWSTLLRSYVITSVSSMPLLLKPSLAVMTYLAHSKSRLLNPDHNRLLHAMLKKTFYAQFCAGETALETKQTIQSLKNIGYKGVILGHAREVVLTKEEMQELGIPAENAEPSARDLEEVKRWRDDTLETIKLTQEGDFVALKFTGAGRQALQHLKANIPCALHLRHAVHEMCQLAEQRGVSLLFDAEQAWLQDGIDNWTVYYMKNYNKKRAVVYGTYQAYAKRTPGVLAAHLAQAQKENYVLGVKLVRGAYLGSDARELFWDTIEGTHACYDNLAECVLRRQYAGLLQPHDSASASFPNVELILASHNAESVKKAQAIRDEQAKLGQERVRLTYGQLMGMADHVSCEIVQKANVRQLSLTSSTDVPCGVKYLVWGTLGITMKYLLRRARENKDAVSRTIDARKALGKEIAIRLGLVRV